MAQILVRNLNESTKAFLQRRARRNGRSMEAEVREILLAEEQKAEKPLYGLGSEMVAIFSGTGVYLDEPIPEMRDHEMGFRIPEFEP